MNNSVVSDPIPYEIAVKICNEIQEKYKGRWYTFSGLQCWGCRTFSKGNQSKMCFHSRDDYRGCNLVNAAFDKGISNKK